jgi:geranylgeranyl pyrophosphate synthase
VHAQNLLTKYDALNRSLAVADEYAARAASRLNVLPSSDLITILQQIPAFSVHRSA